MDAVLDLKFRIRSLLSPERSVFPPHVPTGGWSSSPTARQALESSLPALRRLHPAGEVLAIEGDRVDPDGRAQSWEIDVWDPATERRIDYRVVDGVPYAPRSSHKIPPRTRHRIVRLASRRIRPFLDSDEAWRRAEEAGGRAFRAEVGTARSHGELRPARRASSLVSRVYINEIRDFPIRTLCIELDDRTGDVLKVEEHRRQYQATIVEADAPDASSHVD